MRIPVMNPLFPWDALEDDPSIESLRELLAAIDDAKLLRSLQVARGRGRNDYPVSVLWGVVVLKAALRHPSVEACLAELHRNEQLRRLIGIDGEHKVPKKWNVSRFLELLGQQPHLSLLEDTFNRMVQRLGEVVPDLGKKAAGDATSLNARRKRKPEQQEHEESQGLPQATGGRKEYTDDEGKVVRVLAWFGYKLHLIVDVKHEVALSYKITSTTDGDAETLPTILETAQRNLPPERIQTLAYDKAADTNDVHDFLHREGIKPLIENRSIWKDDLERMLPGHDGTSNVVYDEAGTICCYDRISNPPVRHPMAYTGYEKDRGTLKYRCPAAHEGWRCPSQARCNAGRPFGMTVRIKTEEEPRRFPAIPRATKQFERLYNGRTAVERVNARLKILWGADDGNVSGSRRFHAQVGVVMAVHAAFATILAAAPRYEGTLGKLRLTPIARALRARLSA